MARRDGNDPTPRAPRRLRATAYRARTRRRQWRRRTVGAGLIAIVAVAAVLGTTNVLGTLAAPGADLSSLARPGPADTLIYAADGSLLADLQPQSGFLVVIVPTVSVPGPPLAARGVVAAAEAVFHLAAVFTTSSWLTPSR